MASITTKSKVSPVKIFESTGSTVLQLDRTSSPHRYMRINRSTIAQRYYETKNNLASPESSDGGQRTVSSWMEADLVEQRSDTQEPRSQGESSATRNGPGSSNGSVSVESTHRGLYAGKFNSYQKIFAEKMELKGSDNQVSERKESSEAGTSQSSGSAEQAVIKNYRSTASYFGPLQVKTSRSDQSSPKSQTSRASRLNSVRSRSPALVKGVANAELKRNLEDASVVIQEEKASSTSSGSSSRSSRSALSQEELNTVAKRALQLSRLAAETRAARMQSSPLTQMLAYKRTRKLTVDGAIADSTPVHVNGQQRSQLRDAETKGESMDADSKGDPCRSILQPSAANRPTSGPNAVKSPLTKLEILQVLSPTTQQPNSPSRSLLLGPLSQSYAYRRKRLASIERESHKEPEPLLSSGKEASGAAKPSSSVPSNLGLSGMNRDVSPSTELVEKIAQPKPSSSDLFSGPLSQTFAYKRNRTAVLQGNFNKSQLIPSQAKAGTLSTVGETQPQHESQEASDVPHTENQQVEIISEENPVPSEEKATRHDLLTKTQRVSAASRKKFTSASPKPLSEGPIGQSLLLQQKLITVAWGSKVDIEPKQDDVNNHLEARDREAVLSQGTAVTSIEPHISKSTEPLGPQLAHIDTRDTLQKTGELEENSQNAAQHAKLASERASPGKGKTAYLKIQTKQAALTDGSLKVTSEERSVQQSAAPDDQVKTAEQNESIISPQSSIKSYNTSASKTQLATRLFKAEKYAEMKRHKSILAKPTHEESTDRAGSFSFHPRNTTHPIFGYPKNPQNDEASQISGTDDTLTLESEWSAYKVSARVAMIQAVQKSRNANRNPGEYVHDDDNESAMSTLSRSSELSSKVNEPTMLRSQRLNKVIHSPTYQRRQRSSREEDFRQSIYGGEPKGKSEYLADHPESGSSQSTSSSSSYSTSRSQSGKAISLDPVISSSDSKSMYDIRLKAVPEEYRESDRPDPVLDTGKLKRRITKNEHARQRSREEIIRPDPSDDKITDREGRDGVRSARSHRERRDPSADENRIPDDPQRKHNNDVRHRPDPVDKLTNREYIFDDLNGSWDHETRQSQSRTNREAMSFDSSSACNGQALQLTDRRKDIFRPDPVGTSEENLYLIDELLEHEAGYRPPGDRLGVQGSDMIETKPVFSRAKYEMSNLSQASEPSDSLALESADNSDVNSGDLSVVGSFISDVENSVLLGEKIAEASSGDLLDSSASIMTIQSHPRTASHDLGAKVPPQASAGEPAGVSFSQRAKFETENHVPENTTGQPNRCSLSYTESSSHKGLNRLSEQKSSTTDTRSTSTGSQPSKQDALQWLQKNYGTKIPGGTNEAIQNVLSRKSASKTPVMTNHGKTVEDDEDDVFFGLEDDVRNQEQPQMQKAEPDTPPPGKPLTSRRDIDNEVSLEKNEPKKVQTFSSSSTSSSSFSAGFDMSLPPPPPPPPPPTPATQSKRTPRSTRFSEHSGMLLDESRAIKSVSSDITSSVLAGTTRAQKTSWYRPDNTSTITEEMQNGKQMYVQAKMDIQDEKGSHDDDEVDQTVIDSTVANSIDTTRNETKPPAESMFMNISCALVESLSNACHIPATIPKPEDCTNVHAEVCKDQSGDEDSQCYQDDATGLSFTQSQSRVYTDDATRMSYLQSRAPEMNKGSVNTAQSSTHPSSGGAMNDSERKVWSEWETRDHLSTVEEPTVSESSTQSSSNQKERHKEKREQAQKTLLEHAQKALSLLVENPPMQASKRVLDPIITDSGIANVDEPVETFQQAESVTPVPLAGSPMPGSVTGGSYVSETSDDQQAVLAKFTAMLKNKGVEVLKLNRRKKWQLRYLTVSRDVTSVTNVGPEASSCPRALLWLKTFSTNNANAVSNVKDHGRGGLMFSTLDTLEVTSPKGDLPSIPRKSKVRFDDTACVRIVYSFQGGRRNLVVCFRSIEDATNFCTTIRILTDVVKREEKLLDSH